MVSERGLVIYAMLQTHRSRFRGRMRVRHVTGVCVAIASESGLNFVIPSATAYFVDFRDDAPGARCRNEHVSTRDEGDDLLELGLFCGDQVA